MVRREKNIVELLKLAIPAGLTRSSFVFAMASAGNERLSREDWKKKQELDELVSFFNIEISCFKICFIYVSHILQSACFSVFDELCLELRSVNPVQSSQKKMLREMRSTLIFHNIWQVLHGT